MIQIKAINLKGIYILYYILLYFRMKRFREHSKLQFEIYVKQVLEKSREYSLFHIYIYIMIMFPTMYVLCTTDEILSDDASW
jgi:hypothetical protein